MEHHVRFNDLHAGLIYTKMVEISVLCRGDVSKASPSSFLSILKEVQRKGRTPAHSFMVDEQDGQPDYVYPSLRLHSVHNRGRT